jgi:hypothetical protein
LPGELGPGRRFPWVLQYRDESLSCGNGAKGVEVTHIEFVSVDHGSTHAEPVEVAREAIWMIDADAAGMTTRGLP